MGLIIGVDNLLEMFEEKYYRNLNGGILEAFGVIFTNGSFCYIPKGVKCPMELSTYFRINEAGTGQFERTLLIARLSCVIVEDDLQSKIKQFKVKDCIIVKIELTLVSTTSTNGLYEGILWDNSCSMTAKGFNIVTR